MCFMPGRDSLLNAELVLRKRELTLHSQAQLCGAHPGPWFRTHSERVTQRCHHLDICWPELVG